MEKTSLLSLFWQADFSIKLIMLILISMSVMSWAVIIEKYKLCKNIAKKIHKFEKLFWSGELLSTLYDNVKNRIDNPLAAVFIAAMKEWNYFITKPDIMLSINKMQIPPIQRINQVMQVAANKQIDNLTKKLSILSIVSSAAPFIGILGTVLGIMNSFRAVAMMKNATIAVVAPGIAEALFTAAIGLFAAIPAYISFNLLNSKIDKIIASVEFFSAELSSLLARQLDLN